MSPCPCCSHRLVRQISRQRIYWFCSSCRQEMPNFNLLNLVDSSVSKFFIRSEAIGTQEALLD